jgi:hypothetical protein
MQQPQRWDDRVEYTSMPLTAGAIIGNLYKTERMAALLQPSFSFVGSELFSRQKFT